MSAIYRHADDANKKLKRYIGIQFQRYALLTKWDSLNVMRTVREMYAGIDDTCRAEYLRVAKAAYADAAKEIKLEKSDSKIDDLFIMAVLTMYSAKTEYRYDTEWERKAERLGESIIAVSDGETPNTNEIRRVMARAMTLAQGQIREMADTVTDEARIRAFEAAGIGRVMWNTQRDGNVCRECAERDGMVYTIQNVPSKHHRCRCYMTAVND